MAPLLINSGLLHAWMPGTPASLAHRWGHAWEHAEFTPSKVAETGAIVRQKDSVDCHGSLAIWQTAVAREIMLLAQTDRDRARTFIGLCGSWKPFGAGGPGLSDAVEWHAAGALVPLDNPNVAQGSWAHLWLVKGKYELDTNQPQPADAAVFCPAGHTLFWDKPENGQDSGTSWTLALFLLQRALEDRDPDVIPRLAKNWMITGIAKSGELTKVALGSKLDNVHAKDRTWLMPSLSWKEHEAGLSKCPAEQTKLEKHRKLALRLVDNLESAWRIAADRGTASDTLPVAWPEDAKGVPLHIFVSGVLQPAVLSAAYVRPPEIVLWVTPEMDSRARELTTLLKRLLPSLVVRSMPLRDASGYIQRMEEALAELREVTGPAIVNATGGNLLMRLAASNLARDNLHLRLIYRDVDHPPGRPDFTELHFEGGSARTLLIGHPADAAEVDYAALCLPGSILQSAAELAPMLKAPPAVKTRWAAVFVFAARGLQRYILRSDQLREMTGATALIEGLPELLQSVLESLGLRPGLDCDVISAAAGAARVAFARVKEARLLGRHWPFLCNCYAPGLEVVSTVIEWPEETSLFSVLEEAEQALAVQRQQPQRRLPEVTPAVMRNPRTGLAAVVSRREDGQCVVFDAESFAKLQRRDKEQSALPEVCRGIGMTHPEQRPPDFNALAGPGRGYLAIVHIDGNGMGRIFLDLARSLGTVFGDGPAAFLAALSGQLREACTGAAREAAEDLRLRYPTDFPADSPWPLLPVVLAGDDFTLVLRAHLAIPFTARYLAAFERRTAAFVAGLRTAWPRESVCLPPGLTAAAGIAIVKRSYPWALGYALAESLTRFTKEQTHPCRLADGRIPSALAFHCVSASTAPLDYDDVLVRELTGSGPEPVTVSLQPYAYGAQTGGRLATLDSLAALSAALAQFPSGKRRELLTLTLEDRAAAQNLRARMAETAGPEAAAALNDALRPLCGAEAPLWNAARRSPLVDALLHLWLASPSTDEPPP